MVDTRLVRRFRIWQIRLLSENINNFKRGLKRTNRKYLMTRLKLLAHLASKQLSHTLQQWYYKPRRVKILNKFQSICVFQAYIQRIQFRLSLRTNFSLAYRVFRKSVGLKQLEELDYWARTRKHTAL